MSMIRPQGGAVATSSGIFFSVSTYQTEAFLRVANTTGNPISYTWWLVDQAAGAVLTRGSMTLAANAVQDVEKGLFMAPNTALEHSAGAAGLAWSVTGYQDDGA